MPPAAGTRHRDASSTRPRRWRLPVWKILVDVDPHLARDLVAVAIDVPESVAVAQLTVPMSCRRSGGALQPHGRCKNWAMPGSMA